MKSDISVREVVGAGACWAVHGDFVATAAPVALCLLENEGLRYPFKSKD